MDEMKTKLFEKAEQFFKLKEAVSTTELKFRYECYWLGLVEFIRDMDLYDEYRDYYLSH